MTSNKIKFIHKNKIIEVINPNPNETLLNYIRLNLKKTGTKEGCASGDCGACSVVIGEVKNNSISYKVINSCIMFLPTLNGKQLILVEDLLSKDRKLHPVQKAMVNNHGSQCGFCTPGFVMSMFSMYKNFSKFNENIIKESIAGNLCRCTGYKPIIKAGLSLNKATKLDEFKKDKNLVIKLLKKINNDDVEINLKGKKYFAPLSIKSLNKVIKKNKNSEFIGGQTDIALKVTQKRQEINSMIYLNSIKELNYILKKKNYVEVGAATPLIDFQSFIGKYYPDFQGILKRYGSVGIRNVGTIAGNICTASPIGDSIPLLLSLEAKVLVSGLKKNKILPLNGFFVGYRKTKLNKGEYINSIRIPLFKGNIFKAYKVSKRFDDDISSVCASFNIRILNNKIKYFKAGYGGMDAIPKRAKNCERVLINSNLDEKLIERAKKAIEKDFKPINDVRASSGYRMEVAKNLLQKCFLEIKRKKLIRIHD